MPHKTHSKRIHITHKPIASVKHFAAAATTVQLSPLLITTANYAFYCHGDDAIGRADGQKLCIIQHGNRSDFYYRRSIAFNGEDP